MLIPNHILCLKCILLDNTFCLFNGNQKFLLIGIKVSILYWKRKTWIYPNLLWIWGWHSFVAMACLVIFYFKIHTLMFCWARLESMYFWCGEKGMLLLGHAHTIDFCQPIELLMQIPNYLLCFCINVKYTRTILDEMSQLM